MWWDSRIHFAVLVSLEYEFSWFHCDALEKASWM